MIVAAMHGPRMATIDCDDTGIHTQPGVINEAIKNLEPEAILEDVVLVYWPKSLVENSLTNNHKLRTQSGKRIVESGGKEVVAIEYFDDDAWNGRTELNNYRYGYQLAIESQEVPVS